MLPHTQYLDPLAAAVGYHFGTIKEQHGIKHACTSHCTFPLQKPLPCLSQVESHFYPFSMSRGKKSDSFSPPIKSTFVILFSNLRRGCFLVFGKRTYYFQFILAVLNDFSELLFKAFFAKYTEVERVVSSVQLVLKSSLLALLTT